MFGGKESSVKANVLRGLQTVGLVNNDFSTTDRANLWRDDASYPGVCEQMLKEVYPNELRDVVPGPVIDKQAATRWFMTTLGCGRPAATKMAAMYALLVEADPSGGDEIKERKPKKMTREAKGQTMPLGESHQPESIDHQQTPSHVPFQGLEMPEMRLNLEIRIDANVTSDQIDKIFESMAKHLYRRDDEGQ